MVPDIQTLYEVLEATWPTAARIPCGPITLRDGCGGGSRVSAATADSPCSDDDIAKAATQMRAMGQDALFMIREGDAALDAQLAQKGYQIKDPVVLFASPIEDLAATLPPKTAFPAWPPLAVQREIWAKGGINAARLAVMDRAEGPKIAILGRLDDRPVGTVYVAIHRGIAMLHALEVDADYRRRSLARHLTIACANWARDNGATHLSLITTRANTAANALYTSLGMEVVGQYHYRIQTDP